MRGLHYKENHIHHIPSPDNTDPGIERLIQAKGKTGPRITMADVQDAIADEDFFFKDLLTICVLTLRNGFTVTGESACAYPENFDAEIGMRIARANAEQKIWPLLGYALKDDLFEEEERANTSWQVLLLVEYSELLLKLDKLNTFLASPAAKEIEDAWLLHEQAKCMADYAGVLQVRIRNASMEPT